MIKYKVSIKNPAQHFIQFEMRFDVGDKKQVEFQLPVWRPGRYELGYFAKNIRHFSIKDEKGKAVKYEKVGHSTWQVNSVKAKSVCVSYEYYANELNAGSSYLTEEQLYINPVNCFFYLPDFAPHKYEVNFVLPKKYKIACSLKSKGNNTLLAKDHWELFDSPLIASDNWQKKIFKVDGVKFHILFQGLCKPDWDRIITDFTKFTKTQIQCFGGFPVKEYWYLVQMPNYRHYHGVEHEKSTVIALGPGYSLMTESVYDNFLGVCSHELYHTWNVKNIKPKEFSPYDFSKENYNRIGYIIEGVTTYMGDKMLWKSGVKSQRWFFKELAEQFKRHMWNEGRLNHSVRDSSFDTWLDGYVAGVPGRKVSIYTEGALLAFILDAEIHFKSKGKKTLDTVMKLLYQNFGSAKNGYEEQDFWDIVQSVHGESMKRFYSDFHDSAVSYQNRFKAALKKMGWSIKEVNDNILRSDYGIIADEKNSILKLHSNSNASKKQMDIGDKIIAVNDHFITNNLKEWLQYFSDQNKLKITFERKGMLNVKEVARSKSLFCSYQIELRKT